MTPLAQAIIKDSLKPPRQRTVRDDGDIVAALAGAHFFDVSDVKQMAVDLSENVGKIVGSEETSFLPAPKTWIEWREPPAPDNRVTRQGWLLEEDPDDRKLVYLTEVFECDGLIVATPRDNSLPLHLVNGPQFAEFNKLFKKSKDPVLATPISDGWKAWGPDNLILAFLLFINTPRIIGRRIHMPHRGLEKRLLKERGPLGKFPLHGWTEILLHVTPPSDAFGDDSTEAHLTGQRALHFCRAHLRVRLGRLEWVRSHWRGDASLGIKQSRYRVSA